MLGPRFGQIMKEAAKKIENMSREEIDALLNNESFELEFGNGDTATIVPEEVKVEELKTWNNCE